MEIGEKNSKQASVKTTTRCKGVRCESNDKHKRSSKVQRRKGNMHKSNNKHESTSRHEGNIRA
jgi:hypothetical protein